MNFELLKKHPYAFGIGAIVLFVVIYLALDSGSSAAPATTSTGGSDLSAADLQMAQLQASANAQQNQINGQIQVAQIQASVANTQTAAQVQTNSDNLAATLAAIQAQTSAQLQATASNNATQVSLAQITTNAQTSQVQIQADENIAQTNALAQIEENQTNAATQQHADTLNYLYGVTNLQAGLQSQALQDQTTVAQAQIQSQHDLSSKAIGIVQQAGLNHGTSSLESYLTQVLETAVGQPGAATAAASEGAAQAQAGAYAQAATVQGLTNLGSSLAAALFM